jgi:hypothetical protein
VLFEELDAADVAPKYVDALVARMEAPCSAAKVRKPVRRLWPANAAGSKPAPGDVV